MPALPHSFSHRVQNTVCYFIRKLRVTLHVYTPTIDIHIIDIFIFYSMYTECLGKSSDEELNFMSIFVQWRTFQIFANILPCRFELCEWTNACRCSGGRQMLQNALGEIKLIWSKSYKFYKTYEEAKSIRLLSSLAHTTTVYVSLLQT